MTGPLAQVHWIHGSADCASNTDPPLQVHRHSRDTFVLRLNKCFNYEGNFLYLLLGTRRAILFDTGAGYQGLPDGFLPLRETVENILGDWSAERNAGQLELVVAHTHSHDDHAHWDDQFADRPATVVVGRSVKAITQFFGLPGWPEGSAVLPLGGRDLTVFPLPGHEASHIAVYDPLDRILLTGDTLYPGLLTIQDWPAFRRSARRLALFAEEHPIDAVLGNHIEMRSAPGEMYPVGTRYQPDERALPLSRSHIDELHAACEAMGDRPRYEVHSDFIIGGN
jgi:glyoxylase-like metal-dependent hydrolase (beta-lactamase superfamily II)